MKQLWAFVKIGAVVIVLAQAAFVGYLTVSDKARTNLVYNTLKPLRLDALTFLHAFTSPRPNAALMLGDSITQNARFELAFPGIEILNYGIGGNRAADIAARLDDVIAARPAKLFLMIGANDVVVTPVEDVVQTVDQIITRLRAELPQTRLHLFSVTPRKAQHRATIAALNQAYQALAQRHQIWFFDLHAQMQTAEGTMNPQYSNDALHYNPAGYRLWFAALKPCLEGNCTPHD